MVAGAEVIRQSLTVAVDAACSAVVPTAVMESGAVAVELDLRAPAAFPETLISPEILEFVPSLRSGSFSDIGMRRDMEDEHICMDDLSPFLESQSRCCIPTSFYGVFDGHGGSDAGSYIRRHALRFFFEESTLPQASKYDPIFLREVENSIRRSFLQVDLALADECTVSSFCGSTALIALVLGRLLLVANVGDCRAVLCCGGKVIDMSHNHRGSVHAAERLRVEKSGGYIDDGYLNGVLSVTRALGDWDMKIPTSATGLPSPLIAEPEFRQALLTEDDEFLIIGCDGIWDVMSSQHAVNVVRRGLRRHGDPKRCARELVMEALRLKTVDNLTVIVVCFSAEQRKEETPNLRCCSLSAEALCGLRNWLDNDVGN